MSPPACALPVFTTVSLSVASSFVMEKGEGGEGEEELDAEMEREFEFFVQDLEEHLLNVGEMDPEQLQEEQQQ